MDLTTLWAAFQAPIAQAPAAAEQASAVSGHDIVTVAACFAAALCMGIGCLGAGLSEGYAASKACEGIARNPQAAPAITRAMIMGQAVTESTAIYALIVALLILLWMV